MVFLSLFLFCCVCPLSRPELTAILAVPAQLYAQAKVVDILLRDKVKRWAEVCAAPLSFLCNAVFVAPLACLQLCLCCSSVVAAATRFVPSPSSGADVGNVLSNPQASNGFLRGVDDKFSRKGSRWIRARDCATRPELRQHIVWGGTKKVDRSIQKILRSYNGDVSRLVSVVSVFLSVFFECDRVFCDAKARAREPGQTRQLCPVAASCK
eukprot:3810495-Rhodomonas_salina.2